MDFFTLAKERYSERAFDTRKIEDEKEKKILESARIAPTACNNQPQKLFILRSEDSLEKLKTFTPYRFNSPLMILVCYDRDVVWFNPREGDKGYNSGEQDCSIVATNMMYTALEMGIHSLWIRGFDSVKLREAYRLPDNIIPVMILALGYPSEKSKPNKLHFERKNIEEIVSEL